MDITVLIDILSINMGLILKNIIKSSKLGRGLRFLPRLSRDLKQTLKDTTGESNESTCFVLKKELLAIID